MSQALNESIDFFENLTVQSLTDIGHHYAERARFVDPFNDVTGIESIRAIFADMFTQMHDPGFQVITAFESQSPARSPRSETHQIFLTWDFQFRFRRFNPQTTRAIHGSSLLVLNADNRIALHRDYWDAADMYGKLPVLGSLMRILKRRISHQG